MVNSTGGDDTLTGGSHATNILVGDARYMYSSQGGDDTLTGGANGATNYLYGDAEKMYADSTGGNDRLVSGANATDQMWGDFAVTDGTATGGHDAFVFGPSNGTDFVNDFHHGEDHIELDGFGALSFANLNIATIDANSDGLMDSIIHFDSSDSVTVYNVTGLTAADFFFVA
jgi:Ca2+-binding RTX toxin-like protein